MNIEKNMLFPTRIKVYFVPFKTRLYLIFPLLSLWSVSEPCIPFTDIVVRVLDLSAISSSKVRVLAPTVIFKAVDGVATLEGLIVR